MAVLIVAGFSFAFSVAIGKHYKVGVLNQSSATDVAYKFLTTKDIEVDSV